MKMKTAVSALIAIALATGGSAFGQGHRDGDERGRQGQAERADRYDRPARSEHDGRRWDRRQGQMRAYADERPDPRGAGPGHGFHRGDRLPVEYRRTQYVVDDWRGHQLSAPPRGYHWVQTGGDYVLVAIGSGIILQLLLNN